MNESNTLANLERKAEEQDKNLRIERKPFKDGFITKSWLQ